MATEQKVKAIKPDEEAFKASLVQAEKDLSTVQEKIDQIKTKIDSAKFHDQDSPAAKRQKELRAELSAIRQQQQGFKTSRANTQEKISGLDANLKARVAEQNSSRSRIPYKNVEELDKDVARLEKQVDSGTMRLADERDALALISNLRRQRKSFAGFDESQRVINDLKAQISELKKKLDNTESKVLSDKYAEVAKKLDAIKEEQDSVFKNINALRDERTKLYKEQQEKFTVIREIKDTNLQQRKAWREHEDELWRIRRERQKAEREAFEREKRRKIADKKLEEASRPAYMDEILTAQGLIRHFDSSYDFSALGLDKDKRAQTGNFRAEVGRTVDGSNIRGVKIVKKDEREDDYFIGTGGKKGKKGKKGNANGTPVEGGKINLSLGVIEEFAKVKMDPPMNQADVPSAIEKLAAKIVDWKKNQETETQENIKKAQEEIDRLEPDSESQRSIDSTGKPGQQVLDEGSERETVDDASEELQTEDKK